MARARDRGTEGVEGLPCPGVRGPRFLSLLGLAVLLVLGSHEVPSVSQDNPPFFFPQSTFIAFLLLARQRKRGVFRKC